MSTFTINGNKISSVTYSINCGPLMNCGVFSNIINTNTKTGVLSNNENICLGNIDKFIAIILNFDSSEHLIEDNIVPTLLLTADELQQPLQVDKVLLTGTHLTSAYLTNTLDKKIVYNIIYS